MPILSIQGQFPQTPGKGQNKPNAATKSSFKCNTDVMKKMTMNGKCLFSPRVPLSKNMP